MVKKIISGGQTGADRAALDVAVELGIPYGGWIPKGRKTEDGRLSDRYRMNETSAIDYAQRTELNILDSDGTIVFSHGELTGGSLLTQRLAKKHNKPCLHIDFDEISKFKVVEIIMTWFDVRRVDVLNIAGSRESEDIEIYSDVRGVLESLMFLPPEHIASKPPKDVTEAVDHLLLTLPMKEKCSIARKEKNELHTLLSILRVYILEELELGSGNESPLKSYCFIYKNGDWNEDENFKSIVKELWQRLKQTHILKVVK